MTSQYLGEADEDHEEGRRHAGVLLVVNLLVLLLGQDEPSHPPHSPPEHRDVTPAHSRPPRRLLRILTLLIYEKNKNFI